jgi:lipopolysaccharide transport system permease protein
MPDPQAMISAITNTVRYRELLAVLVWKNIIVRYKQAYLGLVWAILKPLTLMFIFTLMRSIIGINTGGTPYPVLAFAALLVWTLFQESASEGINSIVGNAHLIRKIYFPREVFPLTAVLTKLVEFGINLIVLALLMAWYGIMPAATAWWLPVLAVFTLLASLCIAFAGAALNVYYRDVAAGLPLILSLMMFLSPIIYPLSMVQDKLLVRRAGGEWSDFLYTVYTLNPMAGIIDAVQRTLLMGQAPDLHAMLPGMIVVGVVLPLSYLYFKHAEAYFVDVI